MADMRHNYVNVSLINEIIDSIKTRQFDIGRWNYCFFGHMARIRGAVWTCFLDEVVWGAEQLNLSREDTATLFFAFDVFPPTRAQAIRCLEILRDEGVVDWRRAGVSRRQGCVAGRDLEADRWRETRL